jgi:TPP-dependent pyruvate/acetoin dehydrogenase alpha subunit
LIEQAEVAAIVKSAHDEIDVAIQFAKDSPAPGVEDLLHFVYTRNNAEVSDV